MNTSYGGESWLKTSEYRHMIFERSHEGYYPILIIITIYSFTACSKKIDRNRFFFLKPILLFEVKYRWPILSGISYHCKVRIRISADLQKVKYRPIISAGRYIGRSLMCNVPTFGFRKKKFITCWKIASIHIFNLIRFK